ncbi:MAG: RagB/SusD family nutrient uptake outer membrane protein [Tannerella sp.]|jgi:hypothetical protein|nr:RagB/SusD family nutrient uptake outer membrane protein [Tannerella sp.]
MKTNKFIILLTVFLFSCESYLDKQPTGDMTLDEVFTQRNYAEAFLNNIYRMLPLESNFADQGWEYRSPWTGGCDEMEIAYGGSYTHAINDGSWNPTNVQSIPIWRECYINIRKCNIFQNRIDNVPMDETTKEKWKAEVFFHRAFNYFQIFRAYGPFVIITDELASDADFLSYKRSPVQECVDFIVEECDKAIAVLPASTGSGEYGRVTSIAAMALKSRVLLYMASPLWNGNTDYASFSNRDGEGLVPQSHDAARWQKAADASIACINAALSAGFGLYRSPDNDPYLNYTNIWQELNNKEWLFVKNCGNYQHLNNCSDPVSFGLFSIMNPTQELVDAYEMADGSTPVTGYTDDGLTPVINPASGYVETGFSTEAHPKGYHPEGVWNMYVNREPRFYASINFAKQTWKNSVLEFWYNGKDGRRNAGSDYCKTGYLMKKIIDHSYRPGHMGNIWRNHTWIFFRLGEIYLNYAEALNEAQGPVDDVYRYVDEIRDRAGLPGLPRGLSKEQMREKIRHERRIELAFETHRFFDVRRWKIAPVTEAQPIHSLQIMAGENASDPAFYERIKVENRVFTNPKHYLFPIRDIEFDKARKYIIQNPEWTGSDIEQD